MTGARSVEIWKELPPSGKSVYYYPGATTEGGAHADGVLLRVARSDGTFWYAMCRGGFQGAEGIFQFVRDPSRFIAVHSGAGYCIAYDDPSIWEPLPMHGWARHAVYSRDADIVMLFDWTSGVGYGPAGRMWATPRLFLDRLQVKSWNADHVVLMGLEPDDGDYDKCATTVLNIRDGAFVSGKPSRFN